MKKQILMLCLSILFLSCNKNKPKIGEYTAIFDSNYTIDNQSINHKRYQDFKIIDIDNEQITISTYLDESISFILDKNGDNVSGVFKTTGEFTSGFSPYYSNEITINGKWTKDKGEYIITGTNSYIVTVNDLVNQQINEYVANGLFEFKSK
jgi:hypothetical protein